LSAFSAAKHLIVEQQLQVSVVGRAVGYERCETFSRVFKRAEGISPKYLRRLVGKYPAAPGNNTVEIQCGTNGVNCLGGNTY
jgi:AraC-like DNA-binding protein